jgi:hypothetical protein
VVFPNPNREYCFDVDYDNRPASYADSNGTTPLYSVERGAKMNRRSINQKLHKLVVGDDDETSRIPTSERVGVDQIDPCVRRHSNTLNRQPVSVRMRVGNVGVGVAERRPSFRKTARWWAQRASKKQQKTLEQIVSEKGAAHEKS